MMKTIKTFLMIILAFSLFSCANDILDNAENPSASTPSADGKTYILVDLETSSNSRTILPATGDFSKNKLTNITVKGKISGSNTNLVTLAHSENYSNFSGRIPIEAGAWEFTVTAELDGIPFKAEKNQTINAGTLNYLGFTLQADNTIYGGLKITTNFKGDANKVIVKLLDQDKQSIATIPDQTITDFNGSDPNFSFIYERPITDESKRLEDGTYYVIFAFYKVDENNASIVAPLNTYRSYVRIAKGVTTTTTISIDLDEVYTITYNCWYNETSGFTDSELEGLTFAGGAVFPEFYSRRSENIILPTPSLTGYTFDHWELDGQTITQITKGTTGDLEIDAFFTEDNSGDQVTLEYVNLGLPSGTLWATMNVGATSVTDIGTHYEWMDGGVDLGQLSSGATMPSANDMATINLGETWVMPTKEQFEELYEYCYFEPVTSYKGVNVSGYVVFRAKNSSHAQVFTGCGLYNIEGNKKEGYSVETDPHIFIPAESDDVYLWASTYAGDSYGGRDQNAYCFFLVDQYEPVETEIIKTTTTVEWEKHPVRPVSTKKGDFVFVEGASISNPPEAFGEYGAFKYVSESSPIVIQNFYMCTHEVTQEEYETYCIYGGTVPSQTTDKDQYPVYNINWYDAIVYCNLRSIAENLTPVYSVGKAGSSTQSVYPSDWDSIRSSVVNGKTKYCGPDERNSYWDSYFNDEVITINSSANGYRLPTNAEWEYAARGGHGLSITQTQFSGSSTLSEVSNGLYETIEKIMQHKKNILGIYDMNSAVNEWFLDPSGDDDYRRISTAQDPIDYNAAVNPNERSTSSMKLGFRVVRNVQ